MKHASQTRRSRNSRGRRNGSSSRMQTYDSNGPDVRIRGTAFQITEKYRTLAKDAFGSGDHILGESYMQYAEHYQRIINAMTDQQASQQLTHTQESSKIEGSKGNDKTPQSSSDKIEDVKGADIILSPADEPEMAEAI